MNMRPEDYAISTASLRKEAERVSQRIGVELGEAARSVREKLESGVNDIQDKAESVKQSFQSKTDDAWKGIKRKTIDYTKREPLYALILAAGAGILTGWATRRIW